MAHKTLPLVGICQEGLMSYSQIARELSLSREGVKKIEQRALKKLAERSLYFQYFNLIKPDERPQ